MQLNAPVLMPVWMTVIAIVGAILAIAFLLRAVLVTLRDRSRAVGDVPMAPDERREWSRKVDDAARRYREGETDLRGLHLELAEVLRGFASARSGEDIDTATAREILDMADTTGPRSIEERLRMVRRGGRPLDTNPLGHVGELLAVWEQPSFDRDPRAAAEQAVKDAGEVVHRW